MVITVTLNPAMDKTLTVDNFSLGKVNRAASIRYDIGGKGINVSKVLVNLHVQSICTGFLGGVWESVFEKELSDRKIMSSFVHIDGETRTNTKIVDKVNNIFTDLNEMGPFIDNITLDKFLTAFNNMCMKGDIVVLSGGVSASLPNNIYETMTSIAKSKGAYVIVDADGVLLKNAIKGNPQIIKPNNHEIASLFNLDENNSKEVLKAACQLQKSGISKVLVSLGEKGAYAITDTGIYYAKALKVPVKSTVGAGDSMVAALVYSLLNRYNDEETLRFATACGTASVMLEGTEACSFEQVNELLPNICIEKMEEL